MTPVRTSPVELVLFDLDGTLIDSAPDLAGAANDLRDAHGLPPLPYEALRPMVGSGARGMLQVALSKTPQDDDFDALRTEFLRLYESRMLRLTRIFEAVEPVLDRFDAAGLRWGIVTNKALRFAEPIVHALGMTGRAVAVIGGDSTPFSKPHPEPLFEAARRAGVDSGRCAYVGDDLRDVQAGRAAGMRTAAAAWGYLGQGEPVHAWGADAILEKPAALLNWLELA
jgi:2-phosphoglycolate phosphatase